MLCLGNLSLVIGGIKSGKTDYAQKALEKKGSAIYLATGQPVDGEMKERIENHQKQRSSQVWSTHEEPLMLVQAITQLQKHQKPILVDCLTLWVSNLMMAHENHVVREKVFDLTAAVDQWSVPVVFVSNEVGLGGISINQTARQFADIVGQLHQDLAQKCQNVFYIVAGLPLELKRINHENP